MKKQWMWCLLALAGSGSMLLAGSSGAHGRMRLRFPAGIHSHRRVRHHHARSVSGPHLPARFLRGAGSANVSLPLTFEPNVGQADPRVRFIGRGKGLVVTLTEQEIDVRAASGAPQDGVRLRLAGSEGFVWRGDGKLRAQSNYFIGRDRSSWRTRVPHFAGARAANAAPGVSLVIYGNDEGVEYDVRIAPGADVSKLRLRVFGANNMRLASGGDLMLRAGETELRMKKPLFYEEWKRGGHRRVDGEYMLDADGSIGFRAGPHDPAATLVVDPSLSLSYDTFLGGTGAETAASLAMDKSGKVYVGGTTTSAASFPETPGARLGPVGGASEFFIAKIDPAAAGANSLLYLTFLGGSGTQAGGLIAVDGLGNVAVTGTTTSADFPVTDGSTPGSGPNATAVSELDPTGSKLVFSTLLAGSGAMSQAGPGGIAVDGSGIVYVASDTNAGPGASSPNLPVTTSALQTTWDGSGSDGFLAVFQPPASPGGAPVLKYCSYLGTNSSGPAGIGGLAVDTSGNAYIAGFSTNSVNGFPSKNALQTSYAGGDSDAFLMKISPGGRGTTDLVYATLLGGSGMDEALAVAVDSAAPPNAYLTGTTNSANFPVHGATAGYQTSLRSTAGTNAFLAVVAQNSATGATSIAYATYLGGLQTDAGQGVAVADPTAVYLTGATTSWDFPWRDNLQPFNGAGDAFVAKLNPTLAGAASMIWATPLGGTLQGGSTGSAAAHAVAADSSGHVYVAGTTTSPDFPTAVTTHGAINGLQPNCASCQAAPPLTDAFVAAIQENATLEPSVYFNLGRVGFPSTPVGTQSNPQPVAVLNGGEAILHISSIAIAGANAADFSLSFLGGCTGSAIAPGSPPACSFEVSFMPHAGGIESAVVTVTDDAPGSPQELELTGSGDAPLAIAPTSLNFGALPQGATSPAQTVTLTNTSSDAVQNVTVVLSGPDAAQFVASGAVCASIPSAGSCSLGFRFQPASTGTFHAEVDVSYALGSPPQAQQVIPLTGLGTSPAPAANVTPPAITFGSTVTGSSSAPQTITLTNLGSAPLNLTSIAITGTNPGDFAVVAASTTCPLASGTL
ncbi:MAG: choice-of-anchor D domain-containing protein, partial [Acidobacteriia bacterium]|nr:choice-of-anchor D domain-containing protein [Terriglobia bacterium]